VAAPDSPGKPEEGRAPANGSVQRRDEDGGGERRRQLRDAIIVAVMLAVVASLHLSIPPSDAVVHDFLRRLYYIPILYAAFAFGMRGGLITAAAATVLFASHSVAALGGLFGANIDNTFEVILYFVMGGLFGRIRDLDMRRTEQLVDVSRRLEEAYKVLEDRAMQLIAVQDYTQSILRSVTSGVITVGPDASVATVNPAAERILDMSEDEMVARSLSALFPNDGGLLGDVQRVLEGRTPRTLRETTIETRGGKVVHAQTSVSRMRDIGGRRLGAVVTIEDVSVVKTLTEQLIRADRLAAMGELTAGVAHEVRNPLGVIRASVQLMEDAECSPDRLREASQVVKQEIDRLDRVIKALLDFGRPAAPSMRRVDVAEVISEVVLFTRDFAGRSGVTIEERYAEDLPEIMGDPEQLKQVFVNLIANAVQAMTETGGTLTVSTLAEDGYVTARFADSGPGIPDDELGKVFDPFFSTRDDGTGLGLTIVHRIVDEHDGHIEVSSEPGRGTTFTVSLPALA
jgi:two-component system, sporulation sensor kinase E